MKKTICVSSIRSVGGTFLDWSIHWLNGQSQYYNVRQGSYISLTSNPLTDCNAHNHQKNHPSGHAESQKFINILQQQTGLTSFYPSLLHADKVCKILNIDTSTLTKEQFHSVSVFQQQDLAKLFKCCVEQSVPFIFIADDPTVQLYHFLNVRSLERMLLSEQAAGSIDEVVVNHNQLFFSDSIKKWQELDLNNIWDIRERDALNMRPFESTHPVNYLDFTQPHLYINCRDLWNNGIDVIHRVMEYLELNIDSTRMTRWIEIYQHWALHQQKLYKFSLYCNHIVDAIVNNWYFELEPLSLIQESVIQHMLIYNHNLNLKTWQLEKFPTNTQDLHKLLEPNIHPI